MKPEISRKAVKYIRNISPVREIMSYADPAYIRNLGLDPNQVISFAGGWVNHKAPKELQSAYKSIVENEDTFHISGGYPPTLGSNECKDILCQYEAGMYEVKNLHVDNIAIGNSSTQLTYNLFQTLLDPGDSILLLDPSYCNIPIQVVMAMEKINILRFPVLDPIKWEYIADERTIEFKKFIIENKPKMILLVSPDNPTSQVLSYKFISSALEAAQEIGSFLVIDFAYKEIVFGQNYPAYFSWKPTENFLSIHSNSKWSRSLGRRLGWIEGPSEVIAAMESFQNASMLCPDMLHQMAIVEYFNLSLSNKSFFQYISEMVKLYENAALFVEKTIKEHLPFHFLKSKGGLYICMNVGEDGASFVNKVLKNTGVLFVPGWGFGRTMHNAVRISYGPLVRNHEKIEEGIKRVAKLIKNQ